MAETIQVPADAALGLLLTATTDSERALCRKLGRAETFLADYRLKGKTPGLSVFCEIANACGFDVVLARGNEQVVVTPSDGASS